MDIQMQQWNVMTRQLMCPVLSRSSLKQQHNAKPKQDDREVPSKKVVMPKPGIPPARITEITSRSQTGMTRTNAHRSHRYAEQCEKHGCETKVKRKWDIQSEKKTAATSTGLSESSHVFFGDHHPHTQSPDCWRSVPVTKGQLGTLSQRYCCTLSCSPYVTKLNS